MNTEPCWNMISKLAILEYYYSLIELMNAQTTINKYYLLWNVLDRIDKYRKMKFVLTYSEWIEKHQDTHIPFKSLSILAGHR